MIGLCFYLLSVFGQSLFTIEQEIAAAFYIATSYLVQKAEEPKGNFLIDTYLKVICGNESIFNACDLLSTFAFAPDFDRHLAIHQKITSRR